MELLRSYIQSKGFYEKGDLETSRKMLDEILDKQPDFFQARFLRARGEFFLKDYPSCESDLNLIVQDHNDHLQARFWLALLDFQEGRIDSAVKRIDDLLALDPMDYRLLYERGLLYLAKNDYKNAMDFFLQATLDEQDLSKPRLEAAKIFFNFGSYDKTLFHLYRAKDLVQGNKAQEDQIDGMINKVLEAKNNTEPLSPKEGASKRER